MQKKAVVRIYCWQVVAAPAPEVNEDAEDPAITLKCLKLLVATLQVQSQDIALIS